MMGFKEWLVHNEQMKKAAEGNAAEETKATARQPLHG